MNALAWAAARDHTEIVELLKRLTVSETASQRMADGAEPVARAAEEDRSPESITESCPDRVVTLQLAAEEDRSPESMSAGAMELFAGELAGPAPQRSAARFARLRPGWRKLTETAAGWLQTSLPENEVRLWIITSLAAVIIILCSALAYTLTRRLLQPARDSASLALAPPVASGMSLAAGGAANLPAAKDAPAVQPDEGIGESALRAAGVAPGSDGESAGDTGEEEEAARARTLESPAREDAAGERRFAGKRTERGLAYSAAPDSRRMRPRTGELRPRASRVALPGSAGGARASRPKQGKKLIRWFAAPPKFVYQTSKRFAGKTFNLRKRN